MQTKRTGHEVLEWSRNLSLMSGEQYEERPIDTAPIGLHRRISEPHEDQEELFPNHFLIGHSLSVVDGYHHLDIEGHEVALNLNRPGVYINPPSARVGSEQRGAFDLLTLETPISHAAHLVGLEESAFVAAIRPLHDGAIYDDVLIGPLIRSMWQATERLGAKSTSLFVEQATQTLALYLTNLAHGPDWGKAAFARNDAVSPADAFGHAASPMDRARLARAVDYIEAHLADPMRLGDIADAAMASPSTLSRAFKAATGRSVWTHVLERRLLRSADMLRTTDIPISQIAHACGFSSQAHLTTAFKRRFGVTPAECRLACGRPALG